MTSVLLTRVELQRAISSKVKAEALEPSHTKVSFRFASIGGTQCDHNQRDTKTVEIQQQRLPLQMVTALLISQYGIGSANTVINIIGSSDKC